jgi:hypothetical protein
VGNPTSDISRHTTILTITQEVPPGTVFNITNSNSLYVKERDSGNILPSAESFLQNEKIQVYLNGNKLIKGYDALWISSSEFMSIVSMDPGDKIEILS